ncbi:MAG: SAM-dependent methyltransferase, partial [Burkholderiaceae bacterium]
MTLQWRDPARPEFWSERFERQVTPWDRGGVPAELQA